MWLFNWETIVNKLILMGLAAVPSFGVAQIVPDHQKADAVLRDYIAKHGKTLPNDVAELYALRRRPGEMFDWLQRLRK